MDKLVQELIRPFLEEDKREIVALYGGGFKPPTAGHFSVVEKTLQEYPEIDKLIVLVGKGVRDNIDQSQSILVWEIYQNYLPMKVEIQPSDVPIKEIYKYAENNPDEQIYWILGAREGKEDDIKDIKARTSNLDKKRDKYNNIEVKIITTPDEGMSGSNARRSLLQGNQEEFFKFLPAKIKEKEEIFNILRPVVKESLTENTVPKINIFEKCKQLTLYMLTQGEKILPLPKLKIISNDSSNSEDFLGKTAYYDPNSKVIVLYIKNRHPKDIVRSFAHEMIHHKQNLEGRLTGGLQTTNTNEDDALQELEKEAYEKGNIIFRNWTDSLNESFYLDIPKFNQPKTIQQYLIEAINEISLSKENAVDIDGDLTGGTFTVGDITYEYSIKNIPNPYKDLGLFYNIQFTPRGEFTSIPKGGKENYIKILSTMHKIIVDFIDKEQPDYIGISSLDNSGNKNYHTVYNRLTTNNLNLIPGYFRKDSNLSFDSPQGKGRFIVLKKKDSLQKLTESDSAQIGPFYHETNPENIESILKSGLKTKEKGFQGSYLSISPAQPAGHYGDSILEIYLTPNQFLNALENTSHWVDLDPEELDLLEKTGMDLIMTANDLIQFPSFAQGELVVPFNIPVEQITLKGDKKTLNETIRHEGNNWVVYSKDGKKKLGTHKTKEKAEKQLQAIHIQQHKLKENIIPQEKLQFYKEYFTDLSPSIFEVTIEGETIVIKGIDKSYSKNSTNENVPDAEDDGKAAPFGSGYEKVNESKKPYKHKHGFNDKLGKDPFGLNQFARELAQGLEEEQAPSIQNQLKTKYSEVLEKLFLFPSKDGKYVELNLIKIKPEFKNQGWATKILDDLVDWAKENNVILTLSPSDTFGANEKRLEKFYKRFGFKPNKGKNRDFQTKDSMILKEGAYDLIVTQLSKKVLNAWISQFKENPDNLFALFEEDLELKDKKGRSLDFSLLAKLDFKKSKDRNYKVDGGANSGDEDEAGFVVLDFTVDPRELPKKWSTIAMDIRDVLRHEIEHLTQSGYNVIPSKELPDDSEIRNLIQKYQVLPDTDYYKLDKEVDAMLQGLYFKAKKSKKPFKDVIQSYLDIVGLSPEEQKDVKTRWRTRLKALSLPLFEEEIKKEDYTIYLDMDGVLVDFDKQFKSKTGMLPKDYENKYGTDKFWDFIDDSKKGGGVGFWRSIEWMPGGQELYNLASQYKHALLSSPSRSESSRIGKRLWRRDNTPQTKLILAYSANKKNYADKYSILIDDRADNIESWRSKGGIGILYKSSDQAINDLKQILGL